MSPSDQRRSRHRSDLVQLLGVFAEFERATIIDRVINGMERKAARGEWPGGRLPYGLRVDNGHLATVDGEFETVERIFARYAAGTVGCTTLAHELNDDGLRTRSGKPWTRQMLLELLRLLPELNQAVRTMTNRVDITSRDKNRGPVVPGEAVSLSKQGG